MFHYSKLIIPQCLLTNIHALHSERYDRVCRLKENTKYVLVFADYYGRKSEQAADDETAVRLAERYKDYSFKILEVGTSKVYASNGYDLFYTGKCYETAQWV